MCNLDQVVQITRHSVCIIECALLRQSKGPSIYDVHKEGEAVRLRWTHVDGGGGPAPCGRPHSELKLKSTVFFSCKEVGVFFTRISSLDRKKWQYFCDIN